MWISASLVLALITQALIISIFNSQFIFYSELKHISTGIFLFCLHLLERYRLTVQFVVAWNKSKNKIFSLCAFCSKIMSVCRCTAVMFITFWFNQMILDCFLVVRKTFHVKNALNFYICRHHRAKHDNPSLKFIKCTLCVFQNLLLFCWFISAISPFYLPQFYLNDIKINWQ